MAASQNKRGTSTGRKNSTAGRGTGSKGKSSSSRGRKPAGSNKKNTQVIENKGMYDEIAVISALAVAILFILSTYNLCGKVGDWVSGFIFGVFGWFAYLLPYLLFLGTAFLVSNRQNRVAKFKFAAAAVLYIMLTAFMQMLTVEDSTTMKLREIYLASAKTKRGGGFFGGAICSGLMPLFGKAGTYVIIVVLILICLILVTQRALFASLGHKSKEAYVHAAARREERRAVIRENQGEKAKKAEKTAQAKTERNINIVLPKPTDAVPFVPDVPEMEISDFEAAVAKAEDEPVMHTAEIPVTRMKPLEPVAFEVPVVEEDIETVDEPVPFPNQIGNDGIEPVTGSKEPEVRRRRSSQKTEPMEIQQSVEETPEYVFPPIELLARGKRGGQGNTDTHLQETALKLQQTLDSFGVRVQVTNVSCGPSVTRYELQPEQGVKVSRIVSLSDDIKLNLAVADIRIEAPIPGKAAVGIEVPNKENSTVALRDLLESSEFTKHPSGIAFAAGRDIAGQVIVADIAKMPHLLIAGATGSGKSVCINTLIISILYKSKPEDVRLIMIDPKVVELSVYNGIPHLLIPVVTDPKKAAGALNWAVMEMTDRYQKFAELNVRDFKGYNEKIRNSEYDSETYKKLPQIVIIVDELADLMMVASGEVEDAICRLAQMARAAGLHLVIATQRPSVNVITGLIKANVPSRIAFSVSSGVDSRTIIDMNGAEKLLGKGDMLFYPSGYQKPVRVQGAFVSDREVGSVVEFLKAQALSEQYNEEISNKITSAASVDAAGSTSERDEYFVEAGKFIIEKDKASIGMLQRVYRIGFNRAARIMDQLCDAGVVGPEEGTKPRKVLMTAEEFERYIEEYV